MTDAIRSVMGRLRSAWQFRLTHAGKYFYVALAIGVAWGMATLSIPVYHLACGLLVLVLVPWFGKLAIRPRLTITGQFPTTATAGQIAAAELSVASTSGRRAHEVGLSFFSLPAGLRPVDDEATRADMAPGEPVALPVKLQTLRRGLYPLRDLHAFTTFPLHIWKADLARHPVAPLLVLPDFQPLTDLDVPVGRRYQPGGVTLTSNIGESPEYIGNRDYQHGDPVRRIDFRSWGRLAKPVVREYQEEYYCRIALVLDTFVDPARKAGPEGFPELEAAVSLSATIADALARGEYLIDLFAAGPDLYVFRAGRSIAHFDNILEILACVDECRDSPFETIAPALVDELANISAVIYILLDWDKPREQFVRMAAEVGSSAKVVIVRGGDTSESFFEAEEWAGPVTLLSPEEVRQGRVETL